MGTRVRAADIREIEYVFGIRRYRDQHREKCKDLYKVIVKI